MFYVFSTSPSSPVDPSCECLHDGCHFVFIFPLTSPGDHQAPAQQPGSGAKSGADAVTTALLNRDTRNTSNMLKTLKAKLCFHQRCNCCVMTGYEVRGME